jgi:hypothetical protein
LKSGLFVVLLPLLFAANQPKVGWKRVGSETFALNATEHKSFLITQRGKWRFQLKADAAIYVGVASAEQLGRIRYLTLADFKRFSCVSTRILAAAVSCDLNQPNAQLVVRDERGPITRTAGLVASVKRTGSEEAANRATKPNTITITSYKWECLENCK